MGGRIARNPGQLIVCGDNHVLRRRPGEAVLYALAEAAPAAALTRPVGDRVPECGANEEVLRAHGLDGESLAARVTSFRPQGWQ